MKRIAIVINSFKPHLIETLRHNLEEVLGGWVEIQDYIFDQMKPDEQIDADIVLTMLKSRIPVLRKHVEEPHRILVAQRTIRAQEIYRIFAIPPGTQVLVVNDNPENTLETVVLLQQVNINHLHFVPFEEGMDFEDIQTAITPGEKALVPRQIRTVIDVGLRWIDISTFIEITSRLGIADPEVDRRLLRYSETIVTLDIGVNREYMELYLKNKHLDTVINLSHEGILLLSTDRKVILHNQALAEMLNLHGDLSGSPLDVFDPEIQEVLTRQNGQEWIVEYQGRSLIITRKAIGHSGEPAGSYFNFQEITYIRQLEQNLSGKLREKGLTSRYRFSDVLTQSPKMIQCVDLARRIAGSDLTVLILGESGTGKELLAHSIHHQSPRSKQPFVAVNCAAVPETLLESELFGYEGGSFTGALKDGKIGLFQQANHGTVFLDEIADMPLMLQATLLRVLQERQVVRVGSQKVCNVNIRLIAASNHDLEERIHAGLFREDLYYRLNILPLMIPPLRERPEDTFLLLEHFLAERKRKGLTFAPEAREFLNHYLWPGNIRELSNVASYLSFLAEDLVTLDSLPRYLLKKADPFKRESDLLIPRCGLERARAVLSALSTQGRGTGRKKIGESITRDGLAFSEGEVRTVLNLLKEAGLVRSRMGRGGCELTPRGRSFLDKTASIP
ncbi:MAG: sigma 54-interacting transcriptional regulator [Holophaga sp.]|jgi:transcriptional regulator with PAS, ATPase and Fis domain